MKQARQCFKRYKALFSTRAMQFASILEPAILKKLEMEFESPVMKSQLEMLKISQKAKSVEIKQKHQRTKSFSRPTVMVKPREPMTLKENSFLSPVNDNEK